MTSHEVTYRGPSSFAVRAAALLADADGVKLTSAARPEQSDDSEEIVLLALTVEATTEALTAAVSTVREALPDGASVMLQGPVGG